jgi:hypothetical protein
VFRPCSVGIVAYKAIPSVVHKKRLDPLPSPPFLESPISSVPWPDQRLFSPTSREREKDVHAGVILVGEAGEGKGKGIWKRGKDGTMVFVIGGYRHDLPQKTFELNDSVARGGVLLKKSKLKDVQMRSKGAFRCHFVFIFSSFVLSVYRIVIG